MKETENDIRNKIIKSRLNKLFLWWCRNIVWYLLAFKPAKIIFNPQKISSWVWEWELSGMQVFSNSKGFRFNFKSGRKVWINRSGLPMMNRKECSHRSVRCKQDSIVFVTGWKISSLMAVTSGSDVKIVSSSYGIFKEKKEGLKYFIWRLNTKQQAWIWFPCQIK